MRTFVRVIQWGSVAIDPVMGLILALAIETGQKNVVFTVLAVATVVGSVSLDFVRRTRPAADPLGVAMDRHFSGLFDTVFSVLSLIAVLFVLYSGTVSLTVVYIVAWGFVIYQFVSDTLSLVFVR